MQIISKLREIDAKSKGLDNPHTPPEELMKELIFFILHWKKWNRFYRIRKNRAPNGGYFLSEMPVSFGTSLDLSTLKTRKFSDAFSPRSEF